MLGALKSLIFVLKNFTILSEGNLIMKCWIPHLRYFYDSSFLRSTTIALISQPRSTRNSTTLRNFSQNLKNSSKAFFQISAQQFTFILYLCSDLLSLCSWKAIVYFLRIFLKFLAAFSVNDLTKYSMKSNPAWSIFFRLIFSSLTLHYFSFFQTKFNS